MDYIFQTETIHDLNVHREFSRGFLYSNKGRSILLLAGSIATVYLITQLDSLFVMYLIIASSLISLISLLTRNSKKGDITYRRMLFSNDGKPVHQIIQIRDDEILCTNRYTGNQTTFHYERFESVIETEHLLILTMKYRLCLILEKRWLRGGTADELKEYLFDHCTNIKKKRPRNPCFGKWVYRFYIVVLIVGLILALLNLPGIRLWNRIANNTTFFELAAELEPLGINTDGQLVSELDDYSKEYSYPYTNRYNKSLYLLIYSGMGEYDYDTWEWTPSDSGVYWFDAEFMNVSTMYTDLLRGVSALDPEELDFSNIREDHSAVNWEQGTGTITVHFDWRGKTHTIDAAVNSDWIDFTVLVRLCMIISNEEENKALYIASDDGQGYLVLYADSARISAIEKVTGIDFIKPYAIIR